MIKTLIFDLGKVIVPFEIERLAKLSGFCGIPESEVRQRLLSAPEARLYEQGRLSSREFFESLQKMLGLDLDFAAFSGIWNSIFDLNPLIEDKFIERLASQKRMLILSDTNELHFEFILDNFPILRHFNDYVVSYRVGHLKPSPEIFVAALEKADCEAHECLFIDDKPGNVEGGLEFGMEAMQFIDAANFEENLWEKIRDRS